MKLLIVNGVNLNMLGKRDSAHYGTFTLTQLNREIRKYARGKGIKTAFVQSNCEGRLVGYLQKCKADGVILNAGAYTHYSYALRDCIADMKVEVVEVHLSDIYNREEFRKTDVLRDVVSKVYYGEKQYSYFKAVDYFAAKGE